MTNHHVISSSREAKNAVAEFEYEFDVYGNEKPTVSFSLCTKPTPIAIPHLDFCLVGISPISIDKKYDLSYFGWLPLNPSPGKAVVGEYLTIIQHPGGERKQICVRENKLLRFDSQGNTLWYATDTVAGSSGSPVFNNSWQVVAIHHSGVPKTDKNGNWLTVNDKIWNSSIDESQIAWIANEGIRISQIRAYLESNFSGHPLTKAILSNPTAPISSLFESPDSTSFHRTVNFVKDGVRLTVPYQVSFRLDHGKELKDKAANNEDLDSTNADTIEKVQIDQSSYQDRTGYNPEFLGKGKLRVPLPCINNPKLKRKILTFKYNGKEAQEIKYWNYSVLLRKDRKLALFSAVNIDLNKRPKRTSRNGDRWYSDPRVGKKNEIGERFYGSQSIEEYRTINPFDRGHLTRRLDAFWGKNEKIAKRNGDDTFHWTNCSPQHWKFNQGSKRWLGLEDYVIKKFAIGHRACVINGPVFDGPLSKTDSNGNLTINVKGKRHKDPKFGSVAIPKAYFKIVVVKNKTNNLEIAAFLMSQEDLLRTIDRLNGLPTKKEEVLSPAEARLYQISISDLESLTGLKFNVPHKTKISTTERRSFDVPRSINDLQDIQMQ